MARSRLATIAVVAAVCTACASGSGGAAKPVADQSTTTRTPSPTASAQPLRQGALLNAPRLPCTGQQLRLRLGDLVSEKTEQSSIMFVLTNESSSACTLVGYPAVTVRDAAGRRLGFRVSRSGDQMVTSAAPRPVVLQPRRSGYFLTNRVLACGYPVTDYGTRVQIRIAATGDALTSPTPQNRTFEWCPSTSGALIIHVSPYVASERAAFSA